MIRPKAYFLLFGLLLNYNLGGNEAIQVTINQGVLEGKTMTSRNNTEFFAFLGIPFVKPPIGRYRWMPPQEPDKWGSQVLNATTMPPKCLQTSLFNKLTSVPEGSEDCLYLNVFTPQVGEGVNLPVVVIFPGGAFTFDSCASIRPEFILDYPVVMVATNYRLGVFGFFNTGNQIASGNQGLKDQVASLKWVRNNIAAFGGDPDSVTIMGMSAGGTSVDYHMYSPLSTGLFQRAICMSGSALAYLNYDEPKTCADRAISLGILSGCRSNSTQEMVDCLKEVPAGELVLSYTKFNIFEENPLPFAIAIEPDSVGNERFLTENPFKMEIVNKVPYLNGFSVAEGGFKAMAYLSNNEYYAKQLNAQMIRYLGIIFTFSKWLPRERMILTAQKIKQYYFGDKPVGEETKTGLVNLFSDGYFYYSAITQAKRYAKLAPVYFYYLDHQNENSICTKLGNYKGDLGGCHGDILISFYPNMYGLPDLKRPDDLALSHKLLDYWYNFIATGNPNGEGGNVWQPIQSDNFEYIYITAENDEMRANLTNDRVAFWDSLNANPPYSVKDVNAVEDQLCRCAYYGCYKSESKSTGRCPR